MAFKDQQLLEEAYKIISEKTKTCKKCNCSDCNCSPESKSSKQAKSSKPDYLDVDGDGNKKEPMKKALKDKLKEHSSFKTLFNSVISEATVCGTKVLPSRQYTCVTEDGETKILKGESVIKMSDKTKFKSIKPAHQKAD